MESYSQIGVGELDYILVLEFAVYFLNEGFFPFLCSCFRGRDKSLDDLHSWIPFCRRICHQKTGVDKGNVQEQSRQMVQLKAQGSS
jgi:hypothetical protein